MVEAFIQNPRQEAQTMECFRIALISAFSKNDTLFHEVFSMGSSHLRSFDFAFGIPSATPLIPKLMSELKPKGKALPKEVEEKSDNEMDSTIPLPECLNDAFIPSPSTTPFDQSLTATFAQLRCVRSCSFIKCPRVLLSF